MGNIIVSIFILRNDSRKSLVTAVSSFENCDWQGDYRPDHQCHNTVVHSNYSMMKILKMNSYTPSNPFTLTLHFEDGTNLMFRVNQRDAHLGGPGAWTIGGHTNLYSFISKVDTHDKSIVVIISDSAFSQQEEQARREREEAEQRAREEVANLARDEAEVMMREEEEIRAKEEAEKKAKEEADKKEQEVLRRKLEAMDTIEMAAALYDLGLTLAGGNKKELALEKFDETLEKLGLVSKASLGQDSTLYNAYLKVMDAYLKCGAYNEALFVIGRVTGQFPEKEATLKAAQEMIETKNWSPDYLANYLEDEEEQAEEDVCGGEVDDAHSFRCSD